MNRFNNRPGNYPNKLANVSPKPPLITTAAPNTSQKPIFNKVPRTYNAAEMADRRAKGLCMFCDEPFTPGHQLKHKKTQLLVMEMEEDSSLSEEPETVEEIEKCKPTNRSPSTVLECSDGHL